MRLLIDVLIAAIVALIVYFVTTALIHFSHSRLIFGLISVAVFLILAFGGVGGRVRGVRS